MKIINILFIIGFLRSIIVFFDFGERRKMQSLAENIVLLSFSTIPATTFISITQWCFNCWVWVISY